tara:strand:- start:154 stop:624 length:471 start_codon:yes stop_codon:yes gene_type:complete
MSKKNFKDSTVGKIILGAATMINPTLGNVLQGVTSPKEALAEISKSGISVDDKIKLQQMIYDQQNKEMESVTARWQADMNSVNSGWLSKNVRPLILIWCIVVFSLAGILDSVTTIDFQINSLWNDTFEKVMLAVVFSFFGGRTFEKGANIITSNKK